MKPILFAWCIVLLFLCGCSAIVTDCYVFETETKTIYSYDPNRPNVSTVITKECDLTYKEAKNKAESMTYETIFNNTVKQYTLTTFYKLK